VEKTYVKHVVRFLATNPVAPGEVTGEQLDELLSEYVQQGYRLHSTHVLGVVNDPNPVIRVMHVLTLPEAMSGCGETATGDAKPATTKWHKKEKEVGEKESVNWG